MKFHRRQFLHLVAGTASVLTASRVAKAQAYPSRPIIMIVPFAAGGPSDVAARVIGDHMSRTLGQQLVVQNVAGAGGTIGSLSDNARQSGRLHHPNGPHGNSCDVGLALS
jgi:tripartite-type tricarboxylate transporter receptor subunit TctC